MFQEGLFQDEMSDTGFKFTNDLSFEDKAVEAVEVIKHYMLEGYSLIINISFGKDSSVQADLSIEAISQLIAQGYKVNTLHFLHCNTELENPEIDMFARGEAQKIEEYAEANGLPIKVWITSPNLSNRYLVNVIGGRTIASVPNTSRKCQQQLKAAPLDKMRKTIQKEIKKELKEKFSINKVISLVGTRRDESAVRELKMRERGESAHTPVRNEVTGLYTLSPIADFTTDDIFEYLSEVVNNKRGTYSDFEDLMQVYRDSNGGECMVNMYYGTGSSSGGKTSCNARTGCFVCCAVGEDKSMNNMIREDKFQYMKGLNDFRNYLLANHYDLNKRNWLSRRPNLEEGTVTISPVAYSPEFCLELLKYALTIDAREEDAARELGLLSPRFKMLSLEDILAIDLLWSRYGYQTSLQACAIYHEVYVQRKRYDIPENYTTFRPAPIPKAVDVPFCDEEYFEPFNGFRYLNLAVIDQENVIEKKTGIYNNANVSDEFKLDEEGTELFFGFELEYALEKYFYEGGGFTPTAVIHYLFNLGVVSIHKGGHAEWDRMLRVANQVSRHGIRKHLSNPSKLVEILSSGKQKFKPEEQLILFTAA